MSMIKMVAQASTPANPPSGYLRLFFNASGSLCSVDSTGTVKVYAEGITQEQVEDYVGALLQDTSSVNVTYNDAGNAVTFDVLPGGVDHNSLANLTTGNPHTQYLLSATAASTYQPLDSDLTAVAGLAGTGLVTKTGSGTATTRSIAAGTYIGVTNGDGVAGNPTVAHGNSAVTPATYGSASQVPQIAVGATGHVDSAANVAIQIAQAQVTGLSSSLAGKADLVGNNSFSGDQTVSGAVTVNSTTTGFRPPRMTSAQRLAIAAPAQGMVVYDTDLNCLCVYASTWTYTTTIRSNSVTSTTNNFFGNVTDLTSPSLEVGIYVFEATIVAQSTSATNGIGVRLNGGSATALVLGNWDLPESGAITTTAFSHWIQEASADDQVSGNVPFINQDFLVRGSGLLQINVAGTVAIGVRSEVFGVGVSIRQRSILKIEKVN